MARVKGLALARHVRIFRGLRAEDARAVAIIQRTYRARPACRAMDSRERSYKANVVTDGRRDAPRDDTHLRIRWQREFRETAPPTYAMYTPLQRDKLADTVSRKAESSGCRDANTRSSNRKNCPPCFSFLYLTFQLYKAWPRATTARVLFLTEIFSSFSSAPTSGSLSPGNVAACVYFCVSH